MSVLRGLTIGLYLILLSIKPNAALFKISKVKCESLDKSWAVVNLCECRAIRRGVSVFNMNITIVQTAYKIDAIFAVSKRANGYKPFLYNYTQDGCAFTSKRNHPLTNIIYNLFKDFSNINHTCPYEGDQILKGFYLREEYLTLPWPEGEYALYITWILNKVRAFQTDVYFIFNRNPNA